MEDFIKNDLAAGKSIYYWLYKNGAVTANTGKEVYTAQVKMKNVYGLGAIAKRMEEARSAVKASTIRLVLEDFASMVGTLMEEGCEVNLGGFVRFIPVVHGTFDAEDAPFKRQKHKIMVKAIVGRRLRKAASKSRPIRIERPES